MLRADVCACAESEPRKSPSFLGRGGDGARLIHPTRSRGGARTFQQPKSTRSKARPKHVETAGITFPAASQHDVRVHRAASRLQVDGESVDHTEQLLVTGGGPVAEGDAVWDGAGVVFGPPWGNMQVRFWRGMSHSSPKMRGQLNSST